MERPLAGKRILVVEDEALIGFLIEDMLRNLGAVVVGPMSTVAQGMTAADCEDVDAAMLDINVRGFRSFPIVSVLERRGVPYFFATGYGPSGIEPAHRDVPMINKPFVQNELLQVIETVLA